MICNILPFVFFILFFYLTSFLDTFPIKISVKQKNSLFYLAVIILVLFAGCRWSSWSAGYEAGIFDYDTYKTVFEYPISCFHFISDYLSADITIRQMEFGYVMYSALMHNILGDNYNIYLLLTNFFLIILLLKSFKVNNIVNCLFFIAFFYAARLYLQYNFIIMRQAIAISIVWYSFHFLIRNNIKKYYFLVLLAATFHVTAIICFFIPLLLKIRIKIIYYFIMLLTLFVINALKITDTIILNLIEIAVSSFGVDGLDKLLKYIVMSEEESQGLNLLTFVESVPFVYIALANKKELLSTKEGKFYYNMLFVFLFLLVLTMNFSFITRLWQYLIYTYFYLLSFYAVHSSVKNKCFVFSLLGIYLFIYSLRYIMIWFYDTPYSFFLLH